METGIQEALQTAVSFYARNKAGRGFVKSLLPYVHKSAKLRAQHESHGLHVPPYLIASIATQCNLHCAGCYARANDAVQDAEVTVTTAVSDLNANACAKKEMHAADWTRIFQEAGELGVSFVLLAGGEPLLRRDVLEEAAKQEHMIFPIFTNGTLFNDEYLSFFHTHRNLIPVLSIEGDSAATDVRRGDGVSEKILCAMQKMRQLKMLYGVSITVTTANMDDVTQHSFIAELQQQLCGLIFFVEYVPAEQGTEHLMLSVDDCLKLATRVDALRRQCKSVILVSFPGDEAMMGGCLAAGRGFFHINPFGGAEPCPFSPFSKYNLQEHSMAEVLQSSFFEQLRSIGTGEEHQGGCTLFMHQEEVAALLSHS